MRTFSLRFVIAASVFALLGFASVRRAEARIALPNVQPQLSLVAGASVMQPPAQAALIELVLVPHAWPIEFRPVQAQNDALAASCMVRQIVASQQPGGIDPKLLFLKAQLSREPFKGYKSFKLLAENELALANRQPGKLTLLTKQDLGLTYKEKLAVAGGKARMRMHLTVTDAEKKPMLDTVYAIDEGGTLLQAGMPHAGGTFVLALTCKAK